MNSHQRRATFDDVLLAIGLLTDQVKVLVSAVDDLRCEIEWQARNGMTVDSPLDSVSLNHDYRIGEVEEPAPEVRLTETVGDSLLSATGRLRAFERACSVGPRIPWSDNWATSDDYEIPAGKLIAVSADLWSAVLDIRPAHVIGEGCCCEEGTGAPYLLAWQSGEEFLLHELTDEEARKLQDLCLACRAEQSAELEQRVDEAPVTSQLELF